jgi:DNA helicase-2/ATP-dependent DNA helicase PcrA
VVVRELHAAWAARTPIVIALDVEPASFREPESFAAEPWALGPRFEPWLDRLHFLVWANTYDARGGEPVWWWARKAERLGAKAGGAADVVLPDGREVWIDGGPRQPFDVPVVHRESVELGSLAVQPPSVPPGADLAPDQLAAVSHRGGPARVIAPAGSGKTRVLTERLRHLVVDRGFEREAVLAVAYNKKAQEEMEARCADFRPRVRTLNSLAYSLLGGGRVLEEREVRRIVDGLVPTKRHRANTDPIAPYIEALSEVRLGLRDPVEVEESRDDVPGLAAMFGPYRAALQAAGGVDFDEQVYAAVERLLRDGDFRRRAQAGCRHLLVDELQDLTPAHVLLIRLLAAPALDVFGVGDDDQVIYGHAGADPAFLIEFGDLFPGADHHALEVNYRCPTAVTETARTLLSYNHRRVAKEIRPGPAAELHPEAFQVRRHAPDAGAAALVGVVEEWVADGADPSQAAVLVRVNSMLLAPHVALAEAGVPVASVLRPDVLERTGLRAALAYLRIGAEPEAIAGADVVEILRRPTRGLPQWFPDRLRRRPRWALDSLRGIAETVPDKEADKVRRLVDDLAAVAKAVAGGTTRQALAAIRDDVGLGKAMTLLDGGRGGEGSSHLDDLEALDQVAALHPDPATFEHWLRAVFHREADPGGVTLSTVHRVKGMEWDRVAVYGVTAGLMPHRLADDEEEERRVLHVAMTRGRRRVVLLADASRPSPFLDELTGAAPHRPARPAGRAPKRAAVDPHVELSPEAARAEEGLREWRADRCRRDRVSAFIVLSNRHLRGIALTRPRSLEELAAVEGIGPTKLELYGEEIMSVLERLSS